MSTKSKLSLGETPSKSTPTTPRISRVSRGIAKSDADSPSPLQNSRRSVEKSARSSVISKPSVERRSSKISTLPDKRPTRILKPSELQAELNVAQEDLKKAKEKLALAEKEKVQALEEMKEAQKLAEEANEKLRETLVAQKQAENKSEIEIFRAVEMEQVGIEAAQKKEEELQEEIEHVRNQHAVDVAALLSATQELQRVKRELAMACDAKNQALDNAEDGAKIAEMHAGKVEILSAELMRLKSLLDSRNSWYETEANEKNKLVEDLEHEIQTLKIELEIAKSYEDKLVEKEATVKQLNADLEAAKMAESYTHNLMEGWKRKVEELEVQAEEAHHLERSESVTLESVKKQLCTKNDMLNDAKSEIASLKEKLGLLEMSITRQKGELEESEHHAQMAKEEASEMAKKIDSLISDLETVKQEKIQAIENEKLAADSVQTLLQEKNRLINDLESLKEEEEKSKSAMESLASALHEVSAEAREAKKRFLSSQAEHEHYETQIEDLKLELKEIKEKYESMLDEAKDKLEILTNSIEQSKDEHQKLKAEWEEKELHLMSFMKKTEEENSSMGKELNRLVTLLKDAEDDSMRLKDESMRLKECLTDKENEVQNILQENEELRSKEAAYLKKVEELSMLLEGSLTKKETKASGELSDSEKDYDMLPKVVEFSEQNGGGRLVKPVMELPQYKSVQPVHEIPEELLDITSDDEPFKAPTALENSNGKLNEFENKEKEDDNDKDFYPQRGAEQEESVPRANGGERHDKINGLSSKKSLENGGTSPAKQQSQKKKKPLFHKFGSLLKKKNTSSQK